MPPIIPFADRFWAKVSVGTDDECWPWTGGLSEKRAGTWRGIIRYAGKGSRRLLAHRVALWLQTDPEGVDLAGYDRPDGYAGLQACHRCNNRICCNPGHLYWGTRAQNDADRYGLRAMAEAIVEALDVEAVERCG